MEYTHKKHLAVFRIIYLALIVSGFILYPLDYEGLKLFTTLSSFACLVAGLYLLIKCEMITFTYVINERKTDFNFFINRSMGRRGNYVCYYYISDAVKVVKHTKEAVQEITREHPGCGYYSFCHGIFSKDQYIILFNLNGSYDMVIVEMNEEFKSYFESCMAKAVPVSLNDDEDEDDSNEAEEQIVNEENKNTQP